MVRRRWLPGILTAVLLILSGCAMAARYDVGEPISLVVRGGATSIGLGQTVSLRIEAQDTDQVEGRQGWERLNDPVAISYEATGGELTKRSITSNPLDLMWQSPARAGTYAIMITARDSGRFFSDAPVRQIIEVRVAAAGTVFTPNLRVGANPQTIQLDRRNNTVITAQVFGENTAGKSVLFYATGGTLSATRATTNAAGIASVRLSVNARDIGSITVAASFENNTSTTAVEVVEDTPRPRPDDPIFPPPPPGNISPGFVVNIDPPQLPADGQSVALVRIRITDARGLPVQRQNVVFRATNGIIAPRMSMTDYFGFATAQLTAPNEPGTGYVVVNAGAMQSYAPIVFTATQAQAPAGPPRIFLTLDPTEQMADGAAKVNVEALVLDARNRAMQKTTVTFSASLGKLQQATVETDEEGRAGTVLVAPDRPGLAVVTATAEGKTAASQVAFEGGNAAKPTFDILSWSGQRTYFVAPNWLVRELRVEDGPQSASAAELKIFNAAGAPVKQVALGANVVIARDQYGVAHGYCVQENDTASVMLLHADGTPLRTLRIPLPVGSHVREVKYAEPGGQVLVTIAQPDGGRPAVRFFSLTGTELLTLEQGLERLPVTALGGDGYLVLAFAGGTVRLYNPTGQLIAEARRTDNLQATQAAVGPGGEWMAVAAALAGQTERPPVVSVFARQGGVPFMTANLEATSLVPVSAGALVVGTKERTAHLNLPGKSIAWQISGGFDRFLAVGDLGILAGHHNAEANGVSARITVVGLRDGKMVASESFQTGGIIALTPPDANGAVGVLGTFYAFAISLPK